MKISKGYYLKNIAGENIVLPIGLNIVSFNGMITLNNTGAFLWNQLNTEKTEDELVALLLNEYEIDGASAKVDINEFITTLKNASLLE